MTQEPQKDDDNHRSLFFFLNIAKFYYKLQHSKKKKYGLVKVLVLVILQHPMLCLEMEKLHLTTL